MTEERAEKFLELFNKGKEFTEELLRENQRLRYRLATLETESAAGSVSSVARRYRRRRFSLSNSSVNSLPLLNSPRNFSALSSFMGSSLGRRRRVAQRSGEGSAHRGSPDQAARSLKK